MSQDPDLHDPIVITPYNPEWPKLAAEEISLLKSALPYSWLMDMQHVGSTAVPGLAAKPIIDIYLGVTSISEAQQAIEPITRLGYQYWADNPNKEKMYFVKGMPPYGSGRTHHVHIVQHDGSYWCATNLFRDYLRTHPKEAQQYAELKMKLMEKFKYDREAYTDAKYPFIASILHKAGSREEVKR